MEQMTGVDVSWMTHSSSNKDLKRPRMVPNASSSQGKSSPPPHNGSTPPKNENDHELETTPLPIPIRPGVSRNPSSDRLVMPNGTPPKASTSPNMSRRNSWLSSISSKFSGTHPPNHTSVSPSTSTATSPIDPPVQRPAGPSAPKNAVLVHGVKEDGDAPYVPAPPRSGPSFLQSALRRLSSSGGQLSGSAKGHTGLCERKILNVDPHRERCPIFGLEQSKLRRVAFCVDVEIASAPRYTDEEESDDIDNKNKDAKRSKDKGEGATPKNQRNSKVKTEQDDVPKTNVGKSNEKLPEATQPKASENVSEVRESSPPPEKDNTKKKEKKKRSEEERKARKEKKRRLAEANGTIPVELKIDESDSSLSTLPNTATLKTHASPTTDPVRIYRRCCQLRETPVLKRVVEQLTASVATATIPGLVDKLDLSGYWLQLPDLVTLGDYLAVVPVKELAMENCGLTDEGVRVILAGLLAAKLPTYGRKTHTRKESQCPQGGIIERLVLKNNTKIGKDGWRHISLFINMCRPLKTLDLSRIPFPQSITTPPASGSVNLKKTDSNTSNTSKEVSCLLSKAIGDRLAGPEFELLNLGHCGLNSEQLDGLVDGIIKSGLRRLGLAGNGITPVGMDHVARWIRHGNCEGLDLGGNDLRDSLETVAQALDEDKKIYALSLADCNLNPDSLWPLFPALAKLKNFKFIDLSQNHDLFESNPSALSLLRRYLPRLPQLKRIHLTNVSMTPEQAIALAEILPESPSLAHVTLMENTQLAALANAKDEASQEEACALYASLMAAVRVSQSIVCVDIEVPSSDSSEIVKALAKQVVAYCLWNMERGPVAEISGAVAAISDPHAAANEKDVAVPEVLLHIVGHMEGVHENHDDDEPAPDEDYVIGGTGVVKALGICLRNKGNDSRRPSADQTFSDLSRPSSSSATPNPAVKSGKAKDMSKNLLGSARKIRARLQPALVKESKASDHQNYSENYPSLCVYTLANADRKLDRLLFLDHTLQNMIKRFEDEFPETRLSPSLPDTRRMGMTDDVYPLQTDSQGSDIEPEPVFADNQASDDEGGPEEGGLRPTLSRHNSDVSLASRALSQEEGRMHRFGQKIRRSMLKPEGEDHLHGTTGQEIQPAHLQFLRSMVEDLQGEDIRNKIETLGPDAVIAELNNEASILRQRLIESDPEGWQKFKESQEAMQRNSSVANIGSNGIATESAIE
ncbi:Microtubules assembly and stabilization protein [Ciborinia camelliae]|nr:Microtubules assembly and stabilization protein [Ciborinia camelliae]